MSMQKKNKNWLVLGSVSLIILSVLYVSIKEENKNFFGAEDTAIEVITNEKKEQAEITDILMKKVANNQDRFISALESDFFYIKENVILYKDAQLKKKFFEIEKGEFVQRTMKDKTNEDGYAKIKYGDKEGYIKPGNLSKKPVFKEVIYTAYLIDDTSIYEIASDAASVISRINRYSTVQVIGETQKWSRVLLDGNIIGYIKTAYLRDISEFENHQKLINNAIRLRGSYSGDGNKIIEYALNFVGNPYVWGGTDLINGTDCSGFTQGVYKHFGVYINRTSYDQRVNGIEVPVEYALPGDLVLYEGHVGLYMGEGKMVHAANPNDGIMIGPVSIDKPIIGVRRIVN